ncbi:Protein TonB [Komagataeibacter xylinus]
MTYAEQSDNTLQKVIVFALVLAFEGLLVLALLFGLSSPPDAPQEPPKPPVEVHMIKEPPKAMPPARATPPADAPVSNAPPVPDHSAGTSPLNHVVPEYPEDMSEEGREGVVSVACDVEPTGVTSNCQVVSVKGGQAFADAALKAVRRSRYAPTVKNGVPVKEFHHLYTITFSLND